MIERPIVPSEVDLSDEPLVETRDAVDHPTPVLRRGAEVPVIGPPDGVTHRIVLPGSVTDHELGLFDIVLPPHACGPPPHYHPHLTETFFILSGTLTVLCGDTWHTIDAHDAVFVPRDGIHAFRNDTAEPVRFVLVFTPGAARERYFAAMTALFARAVPPTTAEIDAVAARHDQLNLR